MKKWTIKTITVCFQFLDETSTDNSTLELASTTVLTANTTKAPLNTKGSKSTPKADAGGAKNTSTTTKVHSNAISNDKFYDVIEQQGISLEFFFSIET